MPILLKQKTEKQQQSATIKQKNQTNTQYIKICNPTHYYNIHVFCLLNSFSSSEEQKSPLFAIGKFEKYHKLFLLTISKFSHYEQKRRKNLLLDP